MTAAAVQQELVLRLREDLTWRRMGSGLRVLEEHRSLLECIGPERPGATILLGYLAQWVDAGFESPALVRGLLARFSKESRIHLPLIEYLHLGMAEALVAMADEDFEGAVTSLRFVESVEQQLRDNELLALCSFWIGRCLRRLGRYDDALGFTVKARDLALGNGQDRVAALMRINESWLMFQKGRIAEATGILDEVADVLGGTDDYVALGNIQSAYGRIARRQGRHDRALEHFARAIEYYGRRDANHSNLARSRTNIAWVKRLTALQLQKRIDDESARRKAASQHDAAARARLTLERAQLERLRGDAFFELDEAERIYSRTDNHRGVGAVRINRGFLHLDAGEIDLAEAEAAAAYELCEEKRDYIPMARARILQCMVENVRYEEQIADSAELHRHAQRAHEFARDAVELAARTQNRRLLARAFVWQGLTFTNGFFNNPEAARQCCDQASALLRPEGHEFLWDDLQDLRTRILRKARVETVLQEWSQGLVGEKTFQQIEEEFAGIVIPRVWEREGRKVSRVAEKLSVSPKKVRRVLQAAGLMDSVQVHKAE
ncbi:MAG TPA: tetratricopeptide repeat protein [Bryobacteraceae bacterium]|nr:tetratricopeptide repeat protein [Bryobacteraceae bacterium]